MLRYRSLIATSVDSFRANAATIYLTNFKWVVGARLANYPIVLLCVMTMMMIQWRKPVTMLIPQN